MRASGPEAVTMDAVCSRSGVSKSSLYRRFTDRDQMIGAVMRRLPPIAMPLGVEQPDNVNAQAFETLLAEFQRVYTEQIGAKIAGHIIANDDKSVSAMVRLHLLPPVYAVLERFFSHGVETGALRREVNYNLVVQMIMGTAITADRQAGGLPEDWSRNLARHLWMMIAAPDQ